MAALTTGVPMKKLTALLALVLLLSACAPVQAVNVTPVKVYYAGDSGGVKTALDLAVQSGTVSLVSELADAETLVLNGQIPDGAAEQVRAGAGLVLILGERISDAQASALLGKPVSLLAADDAVSLTDAESAIDPLLKEIIWNGAPQVRERWVVDGLEGNSQPLVVAYEDGEAILQEVPGKGFILSAEISNEANPQIQEWGYFNYLIYHLAARSAGGSPLSFADYPAAPIPHRRDRNVLFIFLGAELLFFAGAFIVVRRYSMNHPEALDSLIADKSAFLSKEATTDWERVGFHRPLIRASGRDGAGHSAVHSLDHLSEPDPAAVHPAFRASARDVGTRHADLRGPVGVL